MEVEEKIVESPKGRFVIRPYRESDEQGALSLWHAAFGKKMSRKLWQWKYAKNPFGRQIMLCVSEEGQPVAAYAAIPYRGRWKGKEVRFSHLMDNMSHPDFRGAIGGRRGLFVRTAEEFYSRYGGPHASIFFYGFPGRRHFLLGKRVLKYTALENEPSYLSVQLSEKVAKMIPFKGSVAIRERPDDSLDVLDRTYAQLYPFAVRRNREFLQWRFFEHPEQEYLFYTYETWWRHQSKGYAVVSVHENTATLVDMLLPFAGKDVEDFMARLVHLLKRYGIERIEAWVPSNHFMRPDLQSAGFVKSNEPLGIIPSAKLYHPKLSFQFVNNTIFYTMADGDLF